LGKFTKKSLKVDWLIKLNGFVVELLEGLIIECVEM